VIQTRTKSRANLLLRRKTARKRVGFPRRESRATGDRLVSSLLPGARKWLLFLLALLFLVASSVVTAAAPTVRLDISGLSGVALDNVRAALRIPPGAVTAEGVVDRALLQQFVKRIPEDVQEALQPFGYYDSEADVQTLESDGGYVVRVQVNPGQETRVASAEVSVEGPGNGERSLQRLVDAFPLKKGNILLSQEYEDAKTRLQTEARNLGYLDADFPVHTVDVYRKRGVADIVLVLRTGDRYFFGDVAFSGAPKYPDSFLHRFVTFNKGEVFSFLRLDQTQANLYNSDRFRDVFLGADKESAQDHEVPVSISLVPRPEKRVRLGVGYATDVGARFLARYQDVNIMDKGNEFRSELVAAERLLALTGAFVIPSSQSLRSNTSLHLSLIRETPVTYDADLLALELARERGFGAETQGSAFVRLLNERFTISGETSTSFLVLPGIRMSANRVDSPSRPTKGYRYAVELRGTDRVLGSDTGLVQIAPGADWLTPLPGRFSLLVRSEAGFTFLRQSLDQVPVTLRFFAGGDRSVRGYAYQSLGPKDASGNVTGGKFLLFGSLELERAVGKNWGIAGFYDTGNAFDTFTDISLAQSAGLGIHYYSVVGPIRLDVARQLGVDRPGVRIHFTVGIFL
jgi:translocation and assembly module TamA